MGMGQGQPMPGIAGKVTAVDVTDNAITVQGMRNSTTSYNVDVSGAVIKKNNATTTISSIRFGDTVMVRGTVSGTSVTATSVRDGALGLAAGDGRGMDLRRCRQERFRADADSICRAARSHTQAARDPWHRRPLPERSRA